MANKRHKPEDIVTKLRQVEVLVGQGMARPDGPMLKTKYKSRSNVCAFAQLVGGTVFSNIEGDQA